MRTQIFFIFICLLASNIKSQNKIKFDKSLTPDKITCSDTSFWYDYRDTTYQTFIPYPNNSKVTFNKGFQFGDTIPNCNVALNYDTLFIHIFKITYGLRVYLDITYVNGIFKTELVHDRANIAVIRTFKVDRCNLILNQPTFKKGQTLVGQLDLSFYGSTLDLESNKDKKIVGQMTGLFKAIVD